MRRKDLGRNPFLYASIVLAFAVVFEVAGIASAAWAPPTLSPPNGNPAQPLDTSSVGQTKAGSLVIQGNADQTGGLVVQGSTTGQGAKINPYGYLEFGSVDTNSAQKPFTGQYGGIMYNPASHQLMYSNDAGNGGWLPIGSGSVWPMTISTVDGNGMWGFNLGSVNGWTGFDLSGAAGQRIILGVSNTQIKNGNIVLDAEGPIDQNQWTHQFELRADGSALFNGQVNLNGGLFIGSGVFDDRKVVPNGANVLYDCQAVVAGNGQQTGQYYGSTSNGCRQGLNIGQNVRVCAFVDNNIVKVDTDYIGKTWATGFQDWETDTGFSDQIVLAGWGNPALVNGIYAGNNVHLGYTIDDGRKFFAIRYSSHSGNVEAVYRCRLGTQAQANAGQ